MKKKKADSFTCFLAALCTLIFFLLIRLFLGIQAVYPVVEIPVTLKIEDYTETTAFYGIDLSAFVQNPDEASLGTVPLLLLGKNSLSNYERLQRTPAFPKATAKISANGRGALHHLLPGYRPCI